MAWTLPAVAALSLIGATGAPMARADGPAALKIGFLTDFSGGTTEASRDRHRAFELAIVHVNGGGGVLGMPVAVAVGRNTGEPETAVAEARRLVEIEGVHAIVGPNSSAGRLPVAERVTRPAGIPTVTFSATSPQLTTAADNDYPFGPLFRTLPKDRCLPAWCVSGASTIVGLLHIDDPWGRGLAGSFEAAWTGAVRALGFERGRTGFLTRLRETAAGGAQALVVIAGGRAIGIIVREAMDSGLYDRFAFGNGAKRLDLVRSIDGDRLGGMYGTGPATASDSAASAAWEAAHVAEHGALPVLAYVKETYDATVALALAVQAAGRLDGAAIRDRLRALGSGPGTVVHAGPRGVARALRILAGGAEIDYEGASSSMDWDASGDLRSGHIGIWRFTGDERIEEVGAVPFRQ